MKSRFTPRHQYDLASEEKVGAETAVDVGDEVLTQQQFRDDADINVIVARFGVGIEQIPFTPVSAEYYGDVSDVYDLGEMLRRVQDAKNRFAELPVKIRNRFHNSPAELWNWVNDPENADEAVKMGLLTKMPNEVKLDTSATPPTADNPDSKESNA